MRRTSRGFSSAELLATIALTSTLLAALFMVQQAQTRAQAAQTVFADTQNTTRAGIDLIGRELRMASYDPTGTALPAAPGPSCPGARQGIVEATPTRVRFRQDLDGDGAIAGAGEDVTYDRLGDTVQRRDGGGTPVTLLAGIAPAGFGLRYFDAGSPPTELVPAGSPPALTAGERDCVARVRLLIRASQPNPNPAITQPIVSVAESEVAVRNRALDNF